MNNGHRWGADAVLGFLVITIIIKRRIMQIISIIFIIIDRIDR